jgi:WD40 repeat protein/class 3 adenylate cyclase
MAMSEKDRFEKKKQLAQGQGVTRQKGVLLLADIVDFTPQADQQGPGKTRQFEQAFEAALKTMAPKYKGDYIKRSGDAVLLFFADETDALDFALRLREASRQRELDCGEFACNLRIVAHFGKFDFQYSQGFLTDVTGADAIVVFRMEKRAKKHEILVTQFLLQLIDGELKDKGIQVVKLRDEPLKGLQRQIAVYRLKIPEKETAAVSTNPLIEQMGELERDTRKIPVFGKIYPAMSMQDNFVNLDIAADEETTAREREEQEKEWRDSFELREHKHIHQVRLPLKVSELYEQYKRGIIFGLPGSGKTTILKYFAFRELQKNAMTLDPVKKRIVMFIQCRDIMSYVDWYRRHPGIETDEGPGIEYSIESILGYLVHSFLFTRQAPGPQAAVQAAELTAQRAYYQGRLTLLIDALDEAADREIKENIIAVLKELFFHSKEGKRYGNRFYLTARYPEREHFPAQDAAALKPVFDVRSLDMEQLRQMAEYFYRDNPALYKEFDRVVWQEEIAAKVGGTPLTALLVIAYFQCFLKFDTRFHMYHVLLVFILIRAWKEIKEGVFNKDMQTFFKEARSLVVLEEKPYITAGKIYDALTLLAYGYMGKQEEITEDDLLENFRLFAREQEKPGEAKKEAHRWLNRLKEDQLLVSTGPSRYVFIHATVMEYLAARYLVEKVNDPGYLTDKFPIENITAAVEKVNPVFFQTETLPIAVGSGIREGAHMLRILEKLTAKAKDQEQQNLLHLAALKSLAEWESYIDRQYQRQHLEYLHLDREKQINDNWDAVDWVYRYLLELLLTTDKHKLKTTSEEFKNIAKLSRPYFLEKYLTYEAYWQGDSEMMSLRKELLDTIMKEELVGQWLDRHRVEKEQVPREVEKELVIEAGGSVLTLGTAGYHPEDKNFKYYQEYSGGELIGFLGSPNLKHSGGVTCAAVSPDGRYIISGSSDYTLKLWDIDTGKEIRTFKGHSSTVWSVTFSPQGNVILSGSYDKTLKLWDLDTGKEIRTFKGHSDAIMSVAFSPRENVILSGSSDNTLKLWDLDTGKEIRTFKGQGNLVNSVAFSPRGNVILSGSDDNTLKLWDLETGEEICTFKGHSDAIMSVAFSKKGNVILSGSYDNTLKLWNLDTGKEIRTFKGHSYPVTSVAFSPQGNVILSGSHDNTLKLWNLETGEEIRTFKGHINWVYSVAFNPRGNVILSGSYDKTLKLWNLETGKEIRTFKGHSYPVLSVAFSTQGNVILTGSSDKTLKLWNLETGKEIRTFKGHSSTVWSVAFSTRGNVILSGSYDHTMKLWDLETGKEIRTFKGHSYPVTSVAFSPQGNVILSGSHDNTLKLWDLETGKEIRTFKGHSNWVNSVVFSPQGNVILSGSKDSTLKLWDLETGKEIRTFKGHSSTVWSVAFSPRGNVILSGSDDQTLKLWDLETGKEIRTFKGHSDYVRSVAFSPRGNVIFSGSYDHTLKLWDQDTGQCIKTIPLLWLPMEIKPAPHQPGLFATANANSTVTLFDFSEIIGKG